MKRSKPELLAPAGDLERLKIAILYGADAVYLGGPSLGLRANAINFTFEELEEGCRFAHEHNARVHVTVNIVLHNKEILEVKDYLIRLEKIGVDAIIVSDPAIIDLALKYTNLEIHLSTQQSTLNREACLYWKKKGVKRIVMGREASREEIKDIIDNVPIDVECFIHGAMCASYSGRCVLSNFLTARDANRGGCSQICRWDFNLLGDSKKLKGDKDFTLCTKDLSMLKYLNEMIDMGITSFKIEGRMRSIYYVATIVDVYRRFIDAYLSGDKTYNNYDYYEQVLRNCANRDAVPQFFNGVNDVTTQYYNGREEVSNQDFLGIILSYDNKTNLALVEERNYFKVGDKVDIFGPNIEPFTFTISEIFDSDYNEIDVVRHPKQLVYVKIPEIAYPNDMIRINRINKLTK